MEKGEEGTDKWKDISEEVIKEVEPIQESEFREEQVYKRGYGYVISL